MGEDRSQQGELYRITVESMDGMEENCQGWSGQWGCLP